MKELFILLLACLFSSTADAQYLYGLDPTFGNNGIYEGDTGGVFKIAVQPDKKIIIVGQDIKNYAYNNVIKRFKEDGEFDSSFSNSGVFLVNTNTSSSNQKIVSSIYLQQDGKIILGGWTALVNGNSDLYLIRLKPNGTFDSSFGNNGEFVNDLGSDEGITSIAVQPDNKILICGNISNNYIVVIRYHPNGTLDSSFGNNGIVVPDRTWGLDYPNANDIDLMSDGRIVLGIDGRVKALSAYCFSAVRLLPNGSLDTSFNHTGLAYSSAISGWLVYCKAMSLQPDGKVLLAGYDDSMAIIRFDSTGQPDSIFGKNGVVKLDPAGKVVDMLLQPDGRIVVATNPDGFPYPDSCYTIYRLLPNGSIDSSFGVNGKLLTQPATKPTMIGTLALQPDGKLLAGGSFVQNSKLLLVRYTPDATASITNLPTANDIVLYPNPATNYIYFDLPDNQRIRQLYIYSLDGKLHRTKYDAYLKRFSIEDLANGVYYLKLTLANNQQIIKKLLIQKNN